MNPNLFENLLNESESNYLDFKQEEYQFDGASDEVKSELLKDILAFANAWRRTDAYILLGVKEVKGGRSEVLGISKLLDDASLQQFVNSKVQKPITFSYTAFEFEGNQVGIIHVPVQERPFYLRQNYGRLKKNVVYLRRGSSTVEAEPDEIAKMGASLIETVQSQIPTIDCEFANPETRKLYGKEIEVISRILKIEDPIPDFSPEINPFQLAITIKRTNPNYYRELYKYYDYRYLFKGVSLRLKNTGQVTAYNARVEVAINVIDMLYITKDYLPDRPRKNIDYLYSINNQVSVSGSGRLKSRISIDRHEDSWLLSINFGSIQPKAEEWIAEKILIGSRKPQEVHCDAVIFADNTPDPIRIPLCIRFRTEDLLLKLSDLEKNYEGMINKELKELGL